MVDTAKDITFWVEKIEDAAQESADWAEAALRGRRYYHGHQWDDGDLIEEAERIQITNNVIQPDINQMVARVLDSDPVIDTHGRGAEDFQLGDLWRDLLRWSEEWTGYEFESCWDVRRKCFMDTYQTGEGIEKTWWCPHEEGGLGMVVSEWIDPLEMMWDPESRTAQKLDARWVIHMRPVPVKDLEAEFTHLKGQIKPDFPRFFQNTIEQARFQEYMTLLVGDYSPTPLSSKKEEKAYRFEIWEKEARYVSRYYLKHSGKPAFQKEEDEDGTVKMVPMSEDRFGKLDEDQRKLFEQRERKVFELKKGVMVSDQWGEPLQKSKYDESEGGHGEYPFSWYSNIHDPSQSHAHGNVEGLIGHQDTINRGTSRWLEAMFIANSVFLAVQRGSAPKGEIGKLDNLGKRTLQKFHFYPGQQVPQFVSGPASNAQLFEAGIRFLKESKDDASGIHNVNRAAPDYELSGKAIRALQSEADLFGVLPRKAIESGLRQATTLRLALMQQFMRGARIVRVKPEAEREGYTLFLGEDEERIESTFNLSAEKQRVRMPGGGTRDLPTGDYLTPDNEKGRILPISDRSIRKFDLRFTLDTGRQARREERNELARSFLEMLAPLAPVAATKWAANLMELDNREQLFADLEEEMGLSQLKEMMQQAEKESGGMPAMQLLQIGLQVAKRQQESQGAPPGGPGGAPPPGPPQGAPGPQARPGPQGNGAPITPAMGA